MGFIEGMTRALRHRGPDAGGVWLDPDVDLALGHRRLSVVEISDLGAQPMCSACGRYVIVFNGEIYNHFAMRDELARAGWSPEWRGSSDTETLLAACAAWGLETTLGKAVGMFALALWDRDERRLSLARDRFGEKPMYYGWVGHGANSVFVFGSELKALRRHPAFGNPISRSAVALFLRYGYVPNPYAIYEGIWKLEPGSALTLDLPDFRRRTCRVKPYWRLVDLAEAGSTELITDDQVAVKLLEQVLGEAVSLELCADVPVGAFLSGGVDSSTVVALMQARSSRPVKTFTVGFDEAGFDEAIHAAAVARHLGTDHHEVRVSAGEARNVIPDLPEMFDEPFADSSQIPMAIICRVARRQVTVALSGDGADELFGGYNRHVLGPQLWRRIAQMPRVVRAGLAMALGRLPHSGSRALAMIPGHGLSRFTGKVDKVIGTLASMESVEDLYEALVTEWPPGMEPVKDTGVLPPERGHSYPEARQADPQHRIMLYDGLTYLPDDILVKVDRAAMSVGLETRVPMLDHRVAAVAWRLPLSMKTRGRESKWALRQVLYRYVPRDLIERPKTGFAAPIGQWLRDPLKEWASEMLSTRRLREEGYLDPVAVSRLWREHCSGRRDWTARLWHLLMFQSWLAATKP